MARILVNAWFLVFGVPLHIYSDLSRYFGESQAVYNIRRQKVPHHSLPPPGNGHVERFNRTMHGLLRLAEKKKWANHLKEVIHAYNVAPHGSTGPDIDNDGLIAV